MSDLANRSRSFFERPEGKTGLLFIFLGFIALIFAGNYIFPFVIEAMKNTLHAMALIAVLLTILAIGLNRNFQLLVANGFKSTMRFLTGLIITIDPIGILKNYIEIMQDKLDGIEKNMGELAGQRRKLRTNISNGKSNFEKHMKLANAAKKHGNAMEIQKNTRMAMREKESAERQDVILTRMDKYHEVLDKIKKNLELLKADTEHQVEIKEVEFKSIKAAHKAMSAADKLINGSKDRELFDQTMEHLADDIGMKLGEMDRFMELSESFMSGNELQEQVWDDEGMKLLEEWQSGSDILSYENKREVKALPEATPNLSSISAGQPQTVSVQSGGSKFDSLFDK